MSRAFRSFWLLTAATILGFGILAQALSGPAGPAAHAVVATSTVLLVITVTLLVRVVRFLAHAGPAGTTQAQWGTPQRKPVRRAG